MTLTLSLSALALTALLLSVRSRRIARETAAAEFEARYAVVYDRPVTIDTERWLTAGMATSK